MSVIRPEDEVVRICQELIRIDSSNFGDDSGPGSGQLQNTQPGSSPKWASKPRSSSPPRAVRT
jgi:hypothetical protein